MPLLVTSSQDSYVSHFPATALHHRIPSPAFSLIIIDLFNCAPYLPSALRPCATQHPGSASTHDFQQLQSHTRRWIMDKTAIWKLSKWVNKLQFPHYVKSRLIIYNVALS